MLAAGGSAPEDLIEQVWGDARPGNVIQALRAIIWRLRAGLGPDIGPRYLVRDRTGYVLTIPGSLTDRWELPTRVAHGLRHLTDGEPAAAVADLESAVALWRGEPWQDLSPAPELAGIRASLAEFHDVAIEELQAARIAADITRAIAALTAAAVATPVPRTPLGTTGTREARHYTLTETSLVGLVVFGMDAAKAVALSIRSCRLVPALRS